MPGLTLLSRHFLRSNSERETKIPLSPGQCGCEEPKKEENKLENGKLEEGREEHRRTEQEEHSRSSEGKMEQSSIDKINKGNRRDSGHAR